MNSKTQIWFKAARLRTLPLSLSGIIVGNSLAYDTDKFSWVVFVFALATTIALQVLSNFANDYGDGVKGTDNDSRIGPPRVLQQGLLSRKELKKGIQICTAVALILALSLIFFAFGISELNYSLIFILLGIVSIVAAIKYTWFIFSEVGLRWAIMIAATLGSFLVFCLILVAAVRLNNSSSLLILGLMFGSLTAAIVNILMFFGSKEALQKYVFWSFGSLGNINASELKILGFILLIGLSIAVYSIKNLNSLLLGENYAQSLGVSLKKNRYLLILSSSILAGATTAFVGPIGFIGLAAPHLIRLLIPSTRDHKIILPAVFLGGALLLLICDSIAQIPGSAYVLPINGITSLIGAPLIILLILRQKN